MDIMKANVLLGAVVVLFASSVAATAQTPKLVKQFKDWGVYSFSGQKGKVCYILSKPREKLPADRNHGDVFFFVTTRPGEGVEAEPSVIVGYSFKPESKVTVSVDGADFTMFTQGEGAWIENSEQENRLVQAMRAGSNMRVAGTSTRGTSTSYSYSLSGVTAALRESAASCQ
ncbi:MAG: invasion associated locus B family protein [Pseudomonadota bacterium]